MRKSIVTGVVVAAIAAIGAGGVATATGDDDERPITGDALERASDAALEHVGEGRVTETEAGDEETLYEVEVTLEDGSQVDVQLDEDFVVVSSSEDAEGEDADDDEDD